MEAFDEPFPTNGYQFEIAEVMDCLRRGLQQEPRYGWEESVGNARIMDTLRAQWGPAVSPLRRIALENRKIPGVSSRCPC